MDGTVGTLGSPTARPVSSPAGGREGPALREVCAWSLCHPEAAVDAGTRACPSTGWCAGPVMLWAPSRLTRCPQTPRGCSLAVRVALQVAPHAAASQEAESDSRGECRRTGADTAGRPRPPRAAGGCRVARRPLVWGRGESMPWDPHGQRPRLSMRDRLPLPSQHRAGRPPAAVLDAGLPAGGDGGRGRPGGGCCLQSWGVGGSSWAAGKGRPTGPACAVGPG